MAARTETWTEATLRQYLLYFAAAAAAVPAGIAYAVLATHQLERWWTVLLTLLAGVLLAHFGWRVAERGIHRFSHEDASLAPIAQAPRTWSPPVTKPQPKTHL